MRILVMAAAVLALAAGSAEAQMGAGSRRHANDAKPDNKPKVDEKAYKAALERIPDPKEKYDPWSGARPSEPAKKSK
ncbi:hypothetical protein [Bradyrhizobium cajani]|uniref:Uncharacterized protein n=1 Tax=Bradyrhizobium cajani TaxID=1928661 RepID=A0A844TJD3_9BRAD|nr:hypothetical protein [Bradyrhizobium cajani]MCP3372529.1 hypothetical protein [Bradyrhizobium cajani]MVT76829.1 hypothetical protein [Bradyrhizobium cajani]